MNRTPQAFTLDKDGARAQGAGGRSVAVVEGEDAFSQEPQTTAGAADAAPRRSFWGRLFWGALGGFLSLIVVTAATSYVIDLFRASPALGYLAMSLGAALALSAIVLVARELVALSRLASAEAMRRKADAAHTGGGDAEARRFVEEIIAFYRKDPGTARARTAMEGHLAEIIDGRNLVLIAERELLKDKDAAARAAIAAAASRVAMVTTVSPRAWFDVMFVLAQSFMLITRIATIYSGRPGGFAVWRLSARVASHLAITGGVAVATDAVGQFLGAGLMARISAKLGEGVLNGVLTARVGLSAIAVCRPMPFRALEAPALGDVAGSLMTSGPEKPAG